MTCSSGKRPYPTRAKARKALTHERGPANGSSRDYYLCPECGQWHLTSQRQTETQRVFSERAALAQEFDRRRREFALLEAEVERIFEMHHNADLGKSV